MYAQDYEETNSNRTSCGDVGNQANWNQAKCACGDVGAKATAKRRCINDEMNRNGETAKRRRIRNETEEP